MNLSLTCLSAGPTACTETACKWLIPKHVTSLTYRPLSDMDFTTPRQKKKELDTRSEASAAEGRPPATERLTVSSSAPQQLSATASASQSSVSSAVSSAEPLLKPPSQAELTDFYAKVAQHGQKPALLSLVAPYSDRYVSDTIVNALPLTSLFSHSYASLSVAELLSVALSVDITLSDADIENIELTTRGQSTNKLWFDYRAGRMLHVLTQTDPRTRDG